MSELFVFLRELPGRRKAALAAGCLAVVAMVAAFGWWVMRAPYGVLFSDLSEQDAAAVVRELDKLKVPYQFGPNATTVLVPEASVHKTRLALMSRQLPLNGAVGFELFNNAEFGVSDFVQKVNYLRALQGELTRTIASIEQVQTARVHLALPEQGLFRKDLAKAKASVTVVTRAGQSLTAAQVVGIQRLVGASVPEVLAEDVTVLDQHGVTLSRPAGGEGGNVFAGGGHFDSKVELEAHLTHKAMQVLDRMFGKGQSLVTVDVVLKHEQTRVTTEEVLPVPGLPKDQAPVGVVVRERTVTRDAATEGTRSAGGSTSQETDYAIGKRVEQVISPSGTVARLNVAVVLKHGGSDDELVRVRELVGAAVGAQPARGDVVAVQSLAAPERNETTPVAAPGSHQLVEAPSVVPATPNRSSTAVAVIAMALTLVLGGVVLVARSRRAPRRQPAPTAPSPRRLTESERQAVLDSVQQWLAVQEPRHGA